MDIQFKEYPRVSVGTVAGRIDAATSGEFESKLNDEINKGYSNIVLDMHDVDFLGSAGLRILNLTKAAAESGGGKLVICDPSQQVVESLKIAGFYDVVIPVIENREEAIASM